MRKTIFVLTLILLASCAMFMFYKTTGNLGFILRYRGEKLLALLLVAAAISSATICLQSITHNKILTPSIMGLDALYLLLKISMLLLFGGKFISGHNVYWQFAIDMLVLMSVACLLFVFLLRFFATDILRLLLIGVVSGTLYRSITEFIARILNPEDFAVYQGAAFAQFNHIDNTLLYLGALLLIFIYLILWRLRFVLDVLALGRSQAINLGIAYVPMLTIIMLLIAALVSLSTALVGPVLFFGLLVSTITYQLCPSQQHQYLLSCSALVAAIFLVLGQLLFERVFNMAATLSVVIELFGGLCFIFLLLRQSNNNKVLYDRD